MTPETPTIERKELLTEFNPYLMPVGGVVKVRSHNTEYKIETLEDGLYISGHPKYCPEPKKTSLIGNGRIGYDLELHLIKVGKPMAVEFAEKDALGVKDGIMTTSAVEVIKAEETN